MSHGICDYGCGQKAEWYFNNGKCCCSEYLIECPSIRNKIRDKINKNITTVTDDNTPVKDDKTKIYNSSLSSKREHFPKFMELIKNQFEAGGNKYALANDKESTDLVCEMSCGKTGVDWIIQTCGKYLLRFLNTQREKDLLKIATYMYIAWLKKGYYLNEEHDEDAK